MITALAMTALLVSGTEVHDCPRPDLPFQLDEKVWKALEGSEFYHSLPRSKTVHLKTVRTLTTSSAPPLNEIQVAGEVTVSALTPCLRKADGTATKSIAAKNGRQTVGTLNSQFYGLNGDFVDLGVQKDGTTVLLVTDLKISGNLFPIAIGKTVDIHVEGVSRGQTEVQDQHCQVAIKSDAAKFDSRLSGAAWEIVCETTLTMDGKTQEGHRFPVWLEDTGIFLADIAEKSKLGRNYIPSVGGMDLQKMADSNLNITWSVYDWTIE